MKTLYLDCFCGISGDMTVGALLDAGASSDTIIAAVNNLGLDGVAVSVESVSKSGIKATKFNVDVDPEILQPHRHLPDILNIIDAANIPNPVKKKAVHTFTLLGNAEAQVHGVPVDKVHFHEVGAADSIVDIIAANLALHDLGIECVICAPLVTGGGTVECAHGIMPVPAPATALLLCDMPWEAGDVSGELATPTGVALAKAWAQCYEAVPLLKMSAVGYGAGTRDLPDRANVLRVFVGESALSAPSLESVCILETMVDDMNPELTALLIPKTIQAGAKDAFITPVLAKKGRAAHCLTVICSHEHKHNVADAIFSNSSTLGIRIREEDRYVLKREVRKVQTDWGTVQIKTGLLNEALHCIAPEFDSCYAIAEKYGIATKKVYEAALAAAQKGAFLNE